MNGLFVFCSVSECTAYSSVVVNQFWLAKDSISLLVTICRNLGRQKIRNSVMFRKIWIHLRIKN